MEILSFPVFCVLTSLFASCSGSAFRSQIPVYQTSKLTTVSLSPKSFLLQPNDTTTLSIYFSQPLPDETTLLFTYIEGSSDVSYKQSTRTVVQPLPNITLPAGSTNTSAKVSAVHVGLVLIGLNTTSNEDFTNLTDLFTTVRVVHWKPLTIINAIIGWIYFCAWSISFYPQVVLNFRRKSVIGLNFDFLAYNLTGFLAYGLFNIGMYWIPEVKREYHDYDPHGVNPVQLNDVVFTIHAILVTAFTIFQCFIYERGEQSTSLVCKVLVSASWLFAFVSLFVAVAGKISWLEYLYYFSYIKLGVTLIKYMPQAYMNYRRKSTDGWSIGNVLLDFTGGSFSLLQMFLISYNSDDWKSIFGDPTKFGLGFFSICFDILFMVQHYILYRSSSRNLVEPVHTSVQKQLDPAQPEDVENLLPNPPTQE